MFGGIFVYIVGIYAFLWWFADNFESLFQIFWNLLKAFLQPGMSCSLSQQFGSWAVVTGSTDGIGKEYAKQLAERGINIVLIARNEAKLMNVSKEIESSYPVQTKYIVADFSNGKEIYDCIEQQLQQLSVPIGILVNNVGIFYEYPEEFAKVPSDTAYNMVMTNITSMTMMTHIIINQMKKRKRGMIVNVSSGCALTPSAYGCLYAATKSFANSFTLGLQRECEPFGIKVQHLMPFVVSTNIIKYSKSKNVFIPDVATYCRWAIFTLGKTCDTTGYWAHAIQVAAMKMMPIMFRQIIMKKMARHFHNEYFASSSKRCSADCRICYENVRCDVGENKSE